MLLRRAGSGKQQKVVVAVFRGGGVGFDRNVRFRFQLSTNAFAISVGLSVHSSSSCLS